MSGASSSAIRVPPPAWVVSIDFGTRGSGFAIRKAGAPSGTAPALHEGWPDAPDARYPKDLTATLYCGRCAWAALLPAQPCKQSSCTSLTHREPIAIGWRARKTWTQLERPGLDTHTYMESFKLALHDPVRAAALPPWLNAEKVGPRQCLLAWCLHVFPENVQLLSTGCYGLPHAAARVCNGPI
jgi:hypothetical protein